MKKKKKVEEKNAPSFSRHQEKLNIFFLASFQDGQMHYTRKKKKKFGLEKFSTKFFHKRRK
jgi:hypothetical protein